MRKKIIIIMLLCLITLSGCNRYSLSDVEKLNKENGLVGKDTKKDVEKDANIKSSNKSDSYKVDHGTGQYEYEKMLDQYNIKVVDMSETVNFKGFDVLVKETLVVDNLMYLDELEGDDTFRRFLTCCEPDNIDEYGNYTRFMSDVLLIHTVIKNVDGVEQERELDFTMTPDMYKISGTMIVPKITWQPMGYDKFPDIKPDKASIRRNICELKHGEEVDTWIVMCIPEGEDSDGLLMSTSFLPGQGGDSSGDLFPKGCIFIRLECKDLRTEK